MTTVKRTVTSHFDSSRLNEEGFVFLSEFYPDVSSHIIAGMLGRTIKIPTVPTVQDIRPRRKETTPSNIYSGNYGLDAFPFHTDLAHWYLPPRYMLLRCIRPAPNVFTALLHHDSALAGMNSHTIHRALYRPRRKLNGHLSLLRLIQPTPISSLFRWDSLFLKAVNEEATEVLNHFSSIHVENMGAHIVFNRQGDTLLVDNWTTLHGRSAVPDEGLCRAIERVYLEEVKI